MYGRHLAYRVVRIVGILGLLMQIALAPGQARSLAAEPPPAAPQLYPRALPVPNLAPYALALDEREQRLYLSGDFSYVGQPAGGMALFGLVQPTGRGALPPTDGSINAVVPDGAGGWIIGGEFSRVGRVRRSNLAHILADGSVDPQWQYGFPDKVTSMATGHGFIFLTRGDHLDYVVLELATGNFTSVFPAAYQVSKVLVQGNTLFLSGDFTYVGSGERPGLAAIDLTTRQLLPWNPAADGVLLSADTESVYLAGVAGPEQPYSLIAVAASGVGEVRWSTPVRRDDPEWGGYLAAAVPAGSALYVGGEFSSVGGVERHNLAALDRATGGVLGLDLPVDKTVRSLAATADRLYLGGAFTQVGDQQRFFLAVIDLNTGTLATWQPSLDNAVNSLALAPSALFAGGAFTQIDGVWRGGIVAYSLRSRKPEAWQPRFDGRIEAIAVGPEWVYIVGNFSMVDGVARSCGAAFERTTGALTSWSLPATLCFRGLVPPADANLAGPPPPDRHYALIATSDAVYLGGNFFQSRDLVALDPQTGQQLSWSPHLEGWIDTVVLGEQELFVSGMFTVGAAIERQRLVRVGRSEAQVTALPVAAEEYPTALLLVDDILYVGGARWLLGQSKAAYVQALSVADVSTPLWRIELPALPWELYDAGVTELVQSSNTLFIGGSFAVGDESAWSNLIAVDRHTGALANWKPGPNGRIRQIAVAPGLLVAGGTFDWISGWEQPHLMLYTPHPPRIWLPSIHAGSEKPMLQ